MLFKPGETVVKEYYAELPITVRVVGNYHDLGSFASDLANLPRIVTLHNVQIAQQERTRPACSRWTPPQDLPLPRSEEIAQQRAAAARKRPERRRNDRSSRTTLTRGLAALGLAAAAVLLAGCEADRAELQSWMDETRRNTPPVTEKVSEPKKFEPFVYQAANEPIRSAS